MSRARAASKRLLEAQEAAVIPTPAPSKSRTGTKGTGKKAAAAAPVAARGKAKGKGKAPTRGRKKAVEVVEEEEKEEDEDDEEKVEGEEDAGAEEEEKEPDTTLYCICLGYDTGEQPMIQCEHCSNWFHFNCIGLDEASASNVEAYCCDICEEMGAGHTRRNTDATLPLPSAPTTTSSVRPTKRKKPSKSKAKPKTVATTTKSHSKKKAASPVPVPEENESDEAVSEGGSSPVESDDDVKMDPEEEAEEEEEEDDDGSDVEEGEDDDDDDDEDDLDEDLVKKRPKKHDGGRSKRALKRKVFSGADAVDEEEDGEYVGDEESVLRNLNKKVAKKTTNKGSKRPASEDSSPPPPKRPAAITESPSISGQATDKTRMAVIKQLTTIFSSIFSAVPDPEEAEEKAARFASGVEAVVFDDFSEVDAKGVKGPRAKYLAKVRSLHFNLKANADLRSRISSNEVSALEIATMSAEDLLTPELRAMAESVRAASLKHSVKEVIAAPTAKRTHKGEEEIENFATNVIESEKRAAAADKKDMDERTKQAHERHRERSESFSMAGSPRMDGGSPFAARSGSPFGAAAGSPRNADSPVAGTYSPPISNSPLPNADNASTVKSPDEDGSEDFGFGFGGSPRALDEDDTEEADGEMRPPAPKSRSSFDLKSVWGQVKASPSVEQSESMEESPMDVDGDDRDDDFFSRRWKGRADDDDFEADLLRDDKEKKPLKKDVPAASTTPPAAPPAQAAQLPQRLSAGPPAKLLSELPPVWIGDLIVPDEGGFPAFAVQAGGRAVGEYPDVWRRILPSTLSMDGRIPTSVAVKYLVECSFASTRELIVTAIMPDLTGPTELTPSKPGSASCQAKFQHIVDFYVKKDRIGVIAPPEHLKKTVKDIYIIPLRKEEHLPEYIELLDDHLLPESGRDQDILLGVAVVQAGSIPTAIVTAPKGATTISASLSPISASVAQPPAPTTRLSEPLALLTTTAGPSSLAPPPPSLPASLPPPSMQAPPPSQPYITTQPIAPSLSPFPHIDQNSLSSLLANPALLQSVAIATSGGSPLGSIGSPMSGPPIGAYGQNRGYSHGPPPPGYGPPPGVGGPPPGMGRPPGMGTSAGMGTMGMGPPGMGRGIGIGSGIGGPSHTDDSPPRKTGFVHPSRQAFVPEPRGPPPPPQRENYNAGGPGGRGDWRESPGEYGRGSSDGRGRGGYERGDGRRGGDRGGGGGRGGRGRGGDFSPPMQPGSGWGNRGGRGRGSY